MSPIPGSEWSLIAEVRRQCAADPRVPISIGDDAALVRHPSGNVLATTDMLMDGVDFLVGQTPLELIGRKCLAVNLSDIAAMAGRPTAAFISLALPKTAGREIASGLYKGIFPLAQQFDVAIAGGDTNSWDGPLVVSVTVLGEPTGRGPVQRNGARPGDWIFVTGPLGGSLPSLRHCTFVPRLREAETLHAAAELHALIDLSDGLASDLWHIAEESQVGIVINADCVPIHDDVRSTEISRLDHALSDGEDFELAFCVSPDDGRRLLAQPPAGVRLFHIGHCDNQPGLRLFENQQLRPLPPTGWQHHFNSSSPRPTTHS
jgi:thiamine-monophosphate kinase